MALSNYSIWLCDPRGYRQPHVLHDAVRLNYVLSDTDVGQFSIALPPYYYDLVQMPDAVFEIWRSPDGKTHNCEGVFFADWVEDRYEDGVWRPTFGGSDVNVLLGTRVIAYKANNAYSSKTNNADDMMKYIIRENLGASATDTDRDLTGVGFSVDGDYDIGVSQTRSFSFNRVDDTLRSIRDASIRDGTPIFFRVEAVGFNPLSLVFRAYKNQIGTDRTVTTGGNRLVFDPTMGNISDFVERQDYSEEVTVVYVLGSGIEDGRLVEEVEDTSRSKRSPWRRREAVYDNSQISTSAGAIDAGNAVLNAGQPKKRATGLAISAPGTVYGRDWFLGDRATLRGRKRSYDIRMASVNVEVDGQNESVSCRFEMVE